MLVSEVAVGRRVGLQSRTGTFRKGLITGIDVRPRMREAILWFYSGGKLYGKYAWHFRRACNNCGMLPQDHGAWNKCLYAPGWWE